MRVIECDVCGEVVSAPDDDELVGRLREHAESQHPDAVPEEDAARAVVASQAYDAMDS
jgi:predicted small metal-binding protein